MTTSPHSGANLRDCIRFAEQRGCVVEPRNATGEIVFSHVNVRGCVVVNRRRKDAPRSLTQWLRKVVAA